METVLKVTDLHYNYGEIPAVKGISFYLNRGETVAIVGANGAGKTTTLRAISGLLGGGRKGSIEFNGTEISRMGPDKIAGMGLIQTLEGRRIFPHLTVMENLMTGAYLRKKNEALEELKYVFTLFPRLQEREKQMGGTLSGGEQQMLAVGRALMAKPEVLMMDEPSLGLAPLIIKEIFECVKKINQDGISILLVEQNSKAALEVSQRGYVFETGEIILEGKAQDLLNDENVKRAYLGY
ncbi:MAG: ABC transporter ATP-binding protein [Christensenella sp.]